MQLVRGGDKSCDFMRVRDKSSKTTTNRSIETSIGKMEFLSRRRKKLSKGNSSSLFLREREREESVFKMLEPLFLFFFERNL